MLRRPALALVSTAALLGSLLACAPEDQAAPAASGSAAGSASPAGCTRDQLATVKPGTFTVGTDKPAYSPWFSDDDPKNGKGFESAVAYAVAGKLGFDQASVTWAVVPFTSAYAPGDKSFDVDINQVSITDARRKAVDFSAPYYAVTQTVVTYKGSPIDGATTVAALKDAKLGAQVGTTSYSDIGGQIEPTKAAAVYDTNDLAVQALKNKQIDGIVVDLPTAFFMVAAQLDDGVIVGQLPAGAGQADQFGMVLAKGSALTTCVSQAVEALRADGTLARLEKTWLSGTDGAPQLS
ncbi:ABC transporter substrate-binding protein [Microlunatus flavus]|uniref:Polar amino acid transport system substrate-binding protein n=1 Tax=Microlunatus flavus TaxID=1036181 RepID=A0A1H8ZQP3_9ACTN|nr:ABC transporter substrate-binding protein [Microlunatus flavus]SEP66770.1 polar amino acid transport system substrate-binding protein [Microlunatus flavus]